MSRLETTAEHFSSKAEAYAVSPGHARDKDLDIMAAFAEPGLYDFVLDVGTGPGHTAMRIATRATLVVGVDIAEGLLETARRLAAERDLHNVSFQYADAAHLPFAAESFDLVTCRIAPHHFEDVPAFVREVARVLKPASRFVLEDSLAPDEPAAAAFLHDLETRRDPTHVRSLTRQQWIDTTAAAGMTVTRETVFEKRHPFRDWLLRTGVAEAEADAIEAEMQALPEDLRDIFFELEDGHIVRLRDRKLILRADKTA